MTIYFYIPSDKYGCFSNFSPHGIEMQNLWWSTVEHYFQAQKFFDNAYQQKIRKAPKPKIAATLGRSREMPIRSDWEEVKDEIMYNAVLKKFQSHKEIKTILLSTGDQNLVENSPIDYYWGCGKDGTGLNKLGKILIKVRALLSSNANSLENES
ncbi:MAG: NADAR family protein [Acidobacteria bacterium]|nr:NADAR family protein [Acidobacteriota bacterium]